MHFYRPDLAAPERVSLREAAWASTRGITKPAEIRRRIRARRMQRLPEVCNGRQAAWGLVVPPYSIKRAIDDGRLPAEVVDDTGERWHYEIRFEDVEALARELP